MDFCDACTVQQFKESISPSSVQPSISHGTVDTSTGYMVCCPITGTLPGLNTGFVGHNSIVNNSDTPCPSYRGDFGYRAPCART